MKNYFLPPAALLLLFPCFGQVVESDEYMAEGTQNALIVTLEVPDVKLTEKLWKDLMKDYGGKTKRAKRGDEWLTTGAEIVGINGVNPLDIYAKTTAGAGGNVEHTVWFGLGEEFLSSNRKEQYAEAEKLLLKFAHSVKVESTRIELENAEKKLKDLENLLAKLERQKDSYRKSIADYEKRIEEAKDSIVKNEEQQTDSAQKIELQKQLVEEIQRRLSEIKKQ